MYVGGCSVVNILFLIKFCRKLSKMMTITINMYKCDLLQIEIIVMQCFGIQEIFC